MQKIFILSIFLSLALVALTNPPHQRALAQRAIAEDRVAETLASGGTQLDLSDLTALRQLPRNLSEMANLETLQVRETNLSDLSELAGLTRLQHLDANHTRVADLTPLTGLPALRILYLHDTWVADVTPLTTLPALERLDLGKTQIATLEPLTRAQGLTWLNLHRGHALDGSRSHLVTLTGRADLQIAGGVAYQQDYRPGWHRTALVKLQRLRERLSL